MWTMQTTHNPDWGSFQSAKENLFLRRGWSQSFGNAASTRFLFCFSVSACLPHVVWLYVRKVIMQSWNVPLQRAERCLDLPLKKTTTKTLPQFNTFRVLKTTPQSPKIAIIKRSQIISASVENIAGQTSAEKQCILSATGAPSPTDPKQERDPVRRVCKTGKVENLL